MGDDRQGDEPGVYPAPTLVVGVGRFGLAVLEELGEDWLILQQSGADPSLGNLRLIYVKPSCATDDPAWKESERQTVQIAEAAGESDLPSLALDLVILRTLGLVRFRDGSYQVAVPKDAGVIEEEPGDESHKDDPHRPRLRRRRYFEWWPLSPDPVVSAERLQRLAERSSELDLFITPLINRTRQGHSPRALIAVISRCHALRQRRDPAPWPWVRPLVMKTAPSPEGCLDIQVWDREQAWEILEVTRNDFSTDLLQGLQGVVPPPLPNWREWCEVTGQGKRPKTPLGLRLCDLFIPREYDPVAPLDPAELLRFEWESTGWATEGFGGEAALLYPPVQLSFFRLGLFDHDGTARSELDGDQFLTERLELLADLVYQGLIRLWIDLQRERVEERSESTLLDRRREHFDEALCQSLEILGELLVRDVAQEDQGEARDCETPSWHERRERGEEPSQALSSLLFRPPADTSSTIDTLECRLAHLGLGRPGTLEQRTPLLRSVAISPQDLADEESSSAPPRPHDGNRRPAPSPQEADTTDAPSPPTASGLPALRHCLNEEVREVYRFSFLSSYRNRPTRRPPRLTVYVLGDVSEPFVRTSYRTLLREVHAELLRSFDPIFQLYRQGFDRALSIVPILWMPHPADPLEGGNVDQSRREEAAIIDAVQGVRRWAESVMPANMRRVSQILVNSRVTDMSVLSFRDSVRQTRDFISLQCRNEISVDPWLRSTAIGPQGDDLFASFTCHEIDFPAERAREYLANRLARTALARIREGDRARRPEVPVDDLSPPAHRDLARQAGRELRRQMTEAGERVGRLVEGRGEVDESTTSDQIHSSFGDSLQHQLASQIHLEWRALTERRGRMDDMIDALRRDTSDLLSERLTAVRRQGDQWIEELSAHGGLKAALAGFSELRTTSRELLQKQERLRQSQEALCKRHGIPDAISRLEAARETVLTAADDKPDRKPIIVGLLLTLLLSPPLGGPLAHAAAVLLGLEEHPNMLEWLLGPAGLATGGAALFALVAWWLTRIQRKAVQTLRQAVQNLAATARRIVLGSENDVEQEAASSLRSFFESRLLMAGALATRGFSLHLFEQAEKDLRRAFRLRRSLDVQSHLLWRRAEELGVRPVMDGGGGSKESEKEDLSRLFATRAGEPMTRLIAPESVLDLYRQRVGVEEDIPGLLQRLIHAAGGFEGWRRSACLADTERVLEFGRQEFSMVTRTPVSSQFRFAPEVGRRLLDFANRHYPNMGFGAKFAGSEGLDPDGVRVIAEAALVLPKDLKSTFDEALRAAGRDQRAIQVIEVSIRPNAAYMLSLAQGIRAHSVRNLKRFESFHDRLAMPDDRTFPLSGDPEHGALNHLTTYRSVASHLHDHFRTGNGPDQKGDEEGKGREVAAAATPSALTRHEEDK